MKRTIFSGTVFSTLIVTAVTIALTLLGLTAITRYDNKYILKVGI